MLFVIDVGNTHTVAGIGRGEEIIKQWRFKTDPAMTADELAIYYHNLFAISSIDCRTVTGISIASVVPQLEAAYAGCCAGLFQGQTPPDVISVNHESVAGLIAVKLPHPAEVGADRLVNGIAAAHLYPGKAIVIDFGTAITFDCISEKREYLGGLILPGLLVSLNALTRKAAKLPHIDISVPPETVIGTSTVAAMKSGVLHGYGAMIEGLIDKVAREMSDTGRRGITVIATGGMASIIKPYAPSIDRLEPNLTLTGLLLLHRRQHGG